MTVKVNDSCFVCVACESFCDAVFAVDGFA